MIETSPRRAATLYWLSCDTPDCHNGWRMELASRRGPSWVRRSAGGQGWRTLLDEDHGEILDVCPWCVEQLLRERASEAPTRLYDFED